MSIDWWSLVWQGVGPAVDVWVQAIGVNPWPWLGLLGFALVGWLVPTRARRRRS